MKKYTSLEDELSGYNNYREMTMVEAIAVARRTLAEHYRLVLIDGYHNGQMSGHYEAADAYNTLAKYRE